MFKRDSCDIVRFSKDNIVVEYWKGHPIRFVEYYEGEWYAVLKDVCDILYLRVDNVKNRLPGKTMEYARVPTCDHSFRGVRSGGDHYKKGVSYEGDHPFRGESYEGDVDNIHMSSISGRKKTQDMIVVNEYGIYECLFRSSRVEAIQLREFVMDILIDLRKGVGLNGRQVMRMMDRDVIDRMRQMIWVVEEIYFDDYRGEYMKLVNIGNGNIISVPDNFPVETAEEKQDAIELYGGD